MALDLQVYKCIRVNCEEDIAAGIVTSAETLLMPITATSIYYAIGCSLLTIMPLDIPGKHVFLAYDEEGDLRASNNKYKVNGVTVFGKALLFEELPNAEGENAEHVDITLSKDDAFNMLSRA